MSTNLPRFDTTTASMTDGADLEAAVIDPLVVIDAKGMIFGQGLLASRPAAGVQGRWYWATDVDGGTAYYDTGSAWLAIYTTPPAPYARLGMSASLSVPTATETLVPWTTEHEDTFGMASGGSDVTVPDDGIYDIHFRTKNPNTTLGTYRWVYAKINGTNHQPLPTHAIASPELEYRAKLRLAAGDDISFAVKHDCGSTQLFTSTTTVLEVARIGS